MEEAAAAAQSLQEQASTLTELVGKFRVGNDFEALAPRAPAVQTARLRTPAPQRVAVLNEADWQSF